jgi:hypothetical protein
MRVMQAGDREVMQAGDREVMQAGLALVRAIPRRI